MKTCKLLGCKNESEYNDYCTKECRFIDSNRYTSEDLSAYIKRVLPTTKCKWLKKYLARSVASMVK